MTLSLDSFNQLRQNIKVLCVGDIMLDIFTYGQVDRISPEAPVPVLRSLFNKKMLGGAANVAANFAELGSNITLVGVIGEDPCAFDTLRLLEKYHSIESYIIRDKTRQTTVKNRYVCGRNHLLRVDQESLLPVSDKVEEQLVNTIDFIDSDFDVIVISDYNKGVLTDSLKKKIFEKFPNTIKIVDTKNSDLSAYTGADIIVPNVKELENYVGYKVFSQDQMIAAANVVSTQFSIPRILVTRGEAGMILVDNTVQKIFKFDSLNKNPVDVSGAGDTVVAALAIAMANKYSYEDGAELANIAASIVVGKAGTATISFDELSARVNELKEIGE